MELLVYGSDMQGLEPIISEIMSIMKKNESLNNVDSSISDTIEQYRIVANLKQLNQYGLSARQIAMELIFDRQPSALTTVQVDDKVLDVYVSNDDMFRNKFELE